MLDIKENPIKKRYAVEGVYNVTDVELEYILKHEDVVKNLSNNKKQFISKLNKLTHNTVIVPFFTDVLLYSEIGTQTDLSSYSFKEIIELFYKLSEKRVFTSRGKLMAYCQVLWAYTEYAYNEHYREDIVTSRDITSSIDVESLILEKQVYTIAEIKRIADDMDRIDLKIGILSVAEGLKLRELISLKRIDFTSKENHVLKANSREVYISDELYKLMREYSYIEELERNYTFGSFVGKLRDTEYLMRPFANKRTEGSTEKMSQTHLTTNLNEELSMYGLNTNDIRNYAIWCDIINKIPIEQINKKYDVKFRYYSFAIRDKVAYEKLRQKLED